MIQLKKRHFFFIMIDWKAVKIIVTFSSLFEVVIWESIFICATTIKRKSFQIPMPSSFFIYRQGLNLGFWLLWYADGVVCHFSFFLHTSVSVSEEVSIVVCTFLIQTICITFRKTAFIIYQLDKNLWVFLSK